MLTHCRSTTSRQFLPVDRCGIVSMLHGGHKSILGALVSAGGRCHNSRLSSALSFLDWQVDVIANR